MKLSNGEVVVIDDLIPLQQQIRLYVEACTVPYQLSGSNKFDVQDIKTQKPVSYVDQKWVVENFFTDGVAFIKYTLQTPTPSSVRNSLYSWVISSI